MSLITGKTIASSVVVMSSCVFMWSCIGAADAASPRIVRHPGTHRAAPVPRPDAITVQPGDVDALLQCLLGPGVEVSNAVLTAAPSAAGTFAGALTTIGIDGGIILGSGDITGLVGPNQWDDYTADNMLPGDPDLDALIPGYETFDATILEFDFTCDNPVVMSFQYVFSSEEYNEWVDSPFNDVFGFFLNGVNIATVPATCSHGGIPVAINNVNCQNPHNPPEGSNCNCYRNNDLDDGGGAIDTEMDGLTQVFYATGQIAPGDNHMKIAIADAGDHVLDSNVMIRCQSFTCEPAEDSGACCFGNDCFTLSPHECTSQGGTFLGLDIDCLPSPCAAAGVEGATPGGLPGEFALLRCTPNPVGDAAAISFTTPATSTVVLTVYDVTGRPVRTLFGGSLPAGSHQLTWDGTDADAHRMPAGIYFCRMSAGSFTQTMRLVLGN